MPRDANRVMPTQQIFQRPLDSLAPRATERCELDRAQRQVGKAAPWPEVGLTLRTGVGHPGVRDHVVGRDLCCWTWWSSPWKPLAPLRQSLFPDRFGLRSQQSA
jgi:hypothetical protein